MVLPLYSRPCKGWRMNNWDRRWMDLASLVSTWSKDQSRKAGSVIVNERNVLVSLGWNGFPRGILDDVPSRHERPVKYLWTEHAERNAIFNAAAEGHPLKGCRLYVQMYPCADCARAIIQSGIQEVISIAPNWNDSTYQKSYQVTGKMLSEAGVSVRFFSG